MSRKKPGFIIFAAACLFILGSLIGLSSILSLFFMQLDGTVIFLIVFIGLLCSLFIAAGIGLLKKQNWARSFSIVIFTLIILGNLLPRQSTQGNVSADFKAGQLFAKALMLSLSALGLYALTLNQSVKDYFNHD